MENIRKILEKEKINFKRIDSINNGFLVDANYFIKTAHTKNQKLLLKNEIDIITHCNFDFTPKLINVGKYKSVNYLIYKYINAPTVLSKWNSYDNITKEQIIKLFAQKMKKIHEIDTNFLQKQFCDLNWQKHWNNEFNKLISVFEKFKLNTTNMKNFALFDLDKIFNENKYALIHNNLSLSNMLYDNENLYLINFEKSRFCAVDYELNNLTQNLKNFVKSAAEDDKKNIKFTEKDVSFILQKIKEYYPEIFNNKQIENRLWIYNFYTNIKYALKNDEPELVEFELENFNNFYKNFDLPKRSLEENIIFEISELCRLYQKDSNVNMFKQIHDAIDFGRKFALNLGADAKIVVLSCVLFNQAILTQEGSFLQYHITSAELCKNMLEKYKCDDKVKTSVISCVLNHKSIKNANNNEEKCVAMAVACSSFKNIFDYCKNLLYINPKTKFNDLKEELTQKYNELDNMAKQFLSINLDKQLNIIYKKLFKKSENKVEK